jgi:hypothetical protein
MDLGADFREFFFFSGREEERDAGEGAGEGTHSEGKTSPLYYMTLLHIYTKFLHKVFYTV